MLAQEHYIRIARVLPALQHASPQLIREFQTNAFFVHIPAGKDVFLEGDQADAIALLISGSVRVYKIGETGREITLYRFGHGGSCILTANAILSHKSFPAIATVEQEAEAIMIPADSFREWVKRYDLWREFVFDLLSDRLSTLMAVVDEVVFQRMDRRVASWLLAQATARATAQVKAQPGLPSVIRTTHQEIAAELGSSREVISRILEDFSRVGLIESGRGTIEILDLNELESRAVM